MGIREETEKKVFTYIEEQGMIAPGDRIVAGVSGGADSVCLLLLLQAYGRKVPLSLTVVHVEHGIREDAMEDARYVEGLCGQMGIPFFLTRSDVGRLAREEKRSEEDVGRRVRYQAFRQAAEKMGGGKVAVAHNSNDNAETMLFHLFRGSGIKGISGIPPVREDEGTSIIRPILCLEREEVEAYLRERQMPWRTDSTNSGDDYRRNRIRHHILPYVQQEIAAGAIRHMDQTARQLRETESYLAEQTESALRTCLLRREDARECSCLTELAGVPDIGRATEPAEPGAGRYVLDVAAFRECHEVLQKRMLFALMKQLSPTGKDISAVHVHDALTLFTRQGNRTIVMPFGIIAWRQYGQVVLERRAEYMQHRHAGRDIGPARPGRKSASAQPLCPEQVGTGTTTQPLCPEQVGTGTTARPLCPEQVGTDTTARPLRPEQVGTDTTARPLCPEQVDADTTARPLHPEQVDTGTTARPSCLQDGAVPQWREQPVPVPLGGEIFRTPFLCPLGGRQQLEFSAFFIKKDRELPKNQYTKWFDYDKMEECVVVRSRKEGDYFTISDGAGNVVHKSLKKYMIAEKIPRHLRDGMPLVAMGSHILWLVGRRIGEYFKVDGSTTRVLQIKWCNGCRDSKTEEEDVRAH